MICFYVSVNIRLQSMDGGGVSALTLPAMVVHVLGRLRDPGGVILFSFCLRLQNQTRTTSFSSCRLSAREVISCAAGLGHFKKCSPRLPSRSPRWRCASFVSCLELLFCRCWWDFPCRVGLLSHLFSSGLSLHMFLKLSWRASNLQMVVCEKTFP